MIQCVLHLRYLKTIRRAISIWSFGVAQGLSEMCLLKQVLGTTTQFWRETLTNWSMQQTSWPLYRHFCIRLSLFVTEGDSDKGESLGLLFISNSSSFTTNLCGFLNGVFIRMCLTRRGSSPLTRLFTSKRISLGENCVCVDGELMKNHRQKLGLVCKMKGRCSQSKLSTPQ